MAVAVAKTARLCEAYRGAFRSPLKVDREKGIVEGVKVLGWKSSNRREYTREAAERAVRRGLYEGAKVFVDHQKPGDHAPRPSRDALGVLRNARVTDTGVYADLHYNRRCPFVEEVLEDVERGLGLYGLSHEADAGDYHYKDGVQVITDIAEVTAVALVANPATNTNLWEGSRPVATTLRRYLEARTLDPKLSPQARRRVLEMCDRMGEEMDDMGMDEPSPTDTGGPPDGRSLLNQAIAALAGSGDPADHDLATKVLRLVKPEAGAAEETDDSKDANVDEDRDANGHGYDDDNDRAGMFAAMRKRGQAIVTDGKLKTRGPAETQLTEESARDLCASLGMKPSDALVETITGLTLTKALRVVRGIKEAATPQPSLRPPRSQEPRRQVTEAGVLTPRAAGLKLPDSPQKLREWARNN